MKQRILFSTILFLIIQLSYAQDIDSPTILEVKEDDHVATLYWNSKTNVYDTQYDPDKENNIFSYKVEWGNVNDGFTQSMLTPYRAIQCQPLLEGEEYMARVFALDGYGNQSESSTTVFFTHDPTRVNEMRQRLNGFFDDMNRPMGAFDEKKWNQSYSGCMKMGRVSQHINNQFHGHNVIASNHCDRGVASSRARELFDFTDRTGTIEFDLDGSQKGRQFWYLDLTNGIRKRDLTGQTSLGTTNPHTADPYGMLRIAEIGEDISVSISNESGQLFPLPNMYQDGACGNSLAFCPGENLTPLINVRRHWKIELSKTEIKIFINGIKVIDGSLISEHSPEGIPYEVAQVNWLMFSYNTEKENFLLSMVHWDNFGFDAPENFVKETLIHNYTDGKLGTETPRTGNEFSIGMVSSLEEPATSIIPIPDAIQDLEGNSPLKAELMFTIQGGGYNWTPEEKIGINGHTYDFDEPTSTAEDLSSIDLINTNRPYSAIVEIDPNHLITGDNQIQFFLNNPRLLNIHIEITYLQNSAPDYTPPQEIYSDHRDKLMEFWNTSNTVGPGIVFQQIDDTQFWLLESEFYPTADIKRWYLYEEEVSDQMELTIRGNSISQLAATGTAKGITHYDIWIDKTPIRTVRVDTESPISFFQHTITLDISELSNGIHELFIQAYDINGNASIFDAFQGHALPGDYLPTLINVQNTTSIYETSLDAINPIIIFPNPTDGNVRVQSNYKNAQLYIFDLQGKLINTYYLKEGITSLNLSDLSTGIYITQATDASGENVYYDKLTRI